jgi:hypothetical protein
MPNTVVVVPASGPRVGSARARATACAIVSGGRA